MNNSKVSIFGASGFIGSYFVKSYPYWCIEVPRGELESPTNNILYLISTVDNYNVFTNPTVDIETNLLHTIKVLDSAYKKYGNNFIFTFISSWFVYGNSDSICTEDSPCTPSGFYSITKWCAEQLIKSYCDTFDIPYKILRLSNILGVGDTKASLKKNAFQYLIQQLSLGKKITIYNQPSYRNVMDVRDCVRAIYLVMASGNNNEIYNIGSEYSIDVKDAIETVGKMVKNDNISYMAVPEFHKRVQTKDFRMSTDKLRGLGFQTKYTLEETVNWIIDEQRP